MSGFVQLRNAQGDISLPQEARIISRNTWDTNFNTGINPVLHLGDATLTLDTGLQFTIRIPTAPRPAYLWYR